MHFDSNRRPNAVTVMQFVFCQNSPITQAEIGGASTTGQSRQLDDHRPQEGLIIVNRVRHTQGCGAA
jgi:hypothetical protein